MSTVTQVLALSEIPSVFSSLGKRDSVMARLDPPKSGALLHRTTAIVTPKRPAPAKNLNKINSSPERPFRET